MTQPLLLAMPDSDIAPVTEGAAITRSIGATQKGTISEKLFEVYALRRGWQVATNSGGGNDFDHAVKRPERPRAVIIQTRLAQLFLVQGRPKYHMQFTKTDGSCYSPTAFDVFAVHLPDTDDFIFFTRAEAGNRKATTYTRREHMSRAPMSSAMAFRDPNNWHLLDEVAESLTANRETSFTPTTADVLPLPVQMSTYL